MWGDRKRMMKRRGEEKKYFDVDESLRHLWIENEKKQVRADKRCVL